MMSVVQIDGIFYFQTDMTLNKYRQIKSNHNVALCIDNIQIEGICEEIGHPLKDVSFCDIFQECFKGSYNAYTSLKNERLFSVEPMYIERWIYKDGAPYIETFKIETQELQEQIIGMDSVMQELKSFMNEDGHLVVLPGNYKKKLIAYYYLASKIEIGKQYTEPDINDILNQWAVFHDPATLRREMYNKHLLNRTEDGKYYWKEELPLLEDFIAKYV